MRDRQAENRRYRLANVDRLRAYNQRYCRAYRAAHREGLAIQKHAYYLARRGLLCAKAREYRLTHEEQVRAYRRAYHLAHRERCCAKARDYRAANLTKVRAKDRVYARANRRRLRGYQRDWQWRAYVRAQFGGQLPPGVLMEALIALRRFRQATR
jgi:hypothetical protein